MLKEKVQWKCLSIITLDSVLNAYEMIHPQTFLENINMRKKDKN